MARRARGHRRRNSIAAKKRALLIGGISLAVVLMAFLIVYFVMRSAVNKAAADVIWDNIYVETVELSGMNADEARTALEGLSDDYKAIEAKLVVENAEANVRLGELGFQVSNIDELITEAMGYGKEGSVFSRYQKLKNLKKNPLKFEANYSVSAEEMEKVISEKFSELEGAAVDATIKRENGQFVVTDGKAGIKVDIEASIQMIEEYFSSEWEYNGAETFTLITTVDEPDVTKEQLSQIQDVLGTYTTSFTSTNSRGKNIAHATARINGTVLMPGEEMSASDSMGSRNAENGYLEAGSYLNGETVETYGGGVCQVSSTLYNAVLLAELEITERHPHSMLVNYVQPSMDAAISEGSKDLKIKNNMQYPIYVEGVTAGGKLTFTIYGKETRSASRTISYVHEVISSTDPGKKFVASADAVGVLKKKTSAHTGMKTKLWKVVMENGAEVSREQINSSSYSASAAVYNVGTTTDNAEAKNIITNAIATQNEAAINAAIAQAQAMIAAAQQGAVETTTPEVQNPTPEDSTTEN